jgi:hemoglobin
MSQTMFERYGGFATVRKIVSEFYDRVLESDSLQRHFEHIDMRRLIDHQTQFISSVMGGPGGYTNDQLYRVHAPLGISEADFREIASLLQETLEDFDLDGGDIDFIVQGFRSKEPLIVSGRSQ